MTLHHPSGQHVLMELSGCDYDLLDSADDMEQRLLSCALDGGATVISSHFHQFSPQGLSGVIVIAESHITIHTWPEHGYAAVDVFTCGKATIADAICNLIEIRLFPQSVQRRSFSRTPHATHQEFPLRVPDPTPSYASS